MIPIKVIDPARTILVFAIKVLARPKTDEFVGLSVVLIGADRTDTAISTLALRRFGKYSPPFQLSVPVTAEILAIPQ